MQREQTKMQFRYGSRGPAGRTLAFFLVNFLFPLLYATLSAAQPQARVELHPQKVHVGALLHVTLETLWSGEADVYDIPRPDLASLPDFEIVGQSLSAAKRGKENALTYSFDLKPKKEGAYDLNQMAVHYYEKGKDVPTAISIPSAVVQVLPPERITATTEVALLSATLLVGGGSLALVFSRRKRRGQKRLLEKRQGDSLTRARLHEEIDAGRRLLIEGETGAYIESLCRILESEQVQPHGQKAQELRALADSVKYGGLAPSPDQLKWAERTVRQAIDNAFPADGKEDELNGASADER